jgi:hypothetical protein
VIQLAAMMCLEQCLIFVIRAGRKTAAEVSGAVGRVEAR